MTAQGWGLVAVVGIPLVVIGLAVVWPERVARGVARDNSVESILNRVEQEGNRCERSEDCVGWSRGGLGSFVTDRLPRVRPGGSGSGHGYRSVHRGPSAPRRTDMYGVERRNS